MDEVDPSASTLAPIGRQVTLAGQYLDLIDSSGKLTAVEAKLERNAEIRRQVVAQVVEYGALLAELDAESVEQHSERYLRDMCTPSKYRGASLFDLLSATEPAGPVDGHEAFKERVQKNWTVEASA